MKQKLRLCVLMGGQSAERDVSLNTGATVVRELWERYQIKPVEILAGGPWRVPRGFVGADLPLDAERWFTGDGLGILPALEVLLDEGLDAVFNALHGPLGEDGTIQGFLTTLAIPFTGPDVIPAAVTMDKRLTKQVLEAAGVSTPRHFSLRAAELRSGPVDWAGVVERHGGEVPFPWVFKPNRLGSSVGVAILKDRERLLAGAQEIIDLWPPSAWRDDLLVEEAIVGRELTCAVYEPDGEPRALPPIEIRPRSSAFFDYKAKYTPGASEEICPAPLSPADRERVVGTAVKVHRVFECAPLSRTDMFLTPSGEVQVLEVNTLPGMTATSLVPLAASRAGIPLGRLLGSLVEHALLRAEKGPAHSYNR